MQFYEYQEPIFDNPDIKSFEVKSIRMKFMCAKYSTAVVNLFDQIILFTIK